MTLHRLLRFARAAIPLLFVFLATCERTDLLTGPSFSISDGAHSGGNRDFFFLPPLVPDPRKQPGFDIGGFDPTLDPVVEICLLAGADCAAKQPAGFPLVFTTTTGPGSETVRLVAADEQYIVNWPAGDQHLDPASFYRIRVLVAQVQLGYADVDVVANGSELRNVNTSQYFGLVSNRTLPIKFRIERGAIAVIGIRESIAVRDATSTSFARPIAIDVRETIRVAERVGALPPVAVAIHETLGVTDRHRVLLSIDLGIHETVSVSDQARVLPPVVVGVHETLGLTDQAKVLPAIDLSVREPVRLSDQSRAFPPVAVNVRETVAVADVQKVLPPIELSVREVVSVSDQRRVLPPASVTVQESLRITDQHQVLPPVSIDVRETLRVTDAANVTLD